MAWDFKDVGEFSSAQDAENWARRNNIDPRDLHIRNVGTRVDVEVRRSALSGDQLNDQNNSRRDGFF